jgi:hypothetical protein
MVICVAKIVCYTLATRNTNYYSTTTYAAGTGSAKGTFRIITTSATIGAFGGTLALPGAGLTVVVPPFAVTSPTKITVTAVAGNQVAYQFDPHGTQFLVPLVVTQSLIGTSALSGGLLPQPLVAGYFASLSDLNTLDGTALVSELLSTSVSLLTKTAVFPVFHFSGYLVASGVADMGDGTSQ